LAYHSDCTGSTNNRSTNSTTLLLQAKGMRDHILSTSTDHDARYLRSAQNLNDVANKATSRTNLGLGTAATYTVGTGASQLPTRSQIGSYA
jgi:hypothetical protein